MDKRGANNFVVTILIITIVLVILILLAPHLVLDGKAAAPPPHTLPERNDEKCGDGHCGDSENYRNCPEDCCGEAGDQVRTQHSCCEGLTAVSDICEFEWPEEKETLPVLPPPPPPSTDAIKEFSSAPTGQAIAPPSSTPVEPVEYCWFCVNCGNGICEAHETTENCGIDCAVCGNGICEPPNETYDNCPQDCCAGAGYRGPAVVNCCEGLKKVDPCDVSPPPQYCLITLKQEACINCGDGKCDEYETPKNCPQDCVGNVTNCDELPKLDIDALDRNNQIKFQWKPDTIIPNSKLYIQETNKCVGVDCEWGPETLIEQNYQPGSPNEYSIDMPQEKLKFYQIKTKIKVGPKEANCEPQCLFQGTKSEGWYDPCNEPEPKLFKYDICSEKKVSCCFIGTRSEGFYDIDCDKATEENLISYDTTCHLGAKLCEQKSNVMVKYTQEFKRPLAKTGVATKSGINWLWYVNIPNVADTRDLLNLGGGIFDYVAYWNPEEQKQYGSARGDLELVCLPKGEGKGGQCYERYVITGLFNLEKGKPYFVSLSEGTYEWKTTYVGKVPERVTFEFKYGPGTFSENYIVLPLDTQIRKASQLCKICVDNTICDDPSKWILDQNERIRGWNISEQRVDPITPRICKYTNGTFDVNVDPGKVYLIKVARNASWQQI
ncbi:MAG: hypothetical protein ACPLXC_01990 [Candidatus Pacearchaeota archaeon]